jgi:glycosyltransferase involved in cell wall biosynthesis
MNVLISLAQRFDRTPDGAVWTPGPFPRSFWARYLEVFDRVRVLARVRDVPAPSDGWKRADDERVQFVALPYFVGPWQYLFKAWQTRRALREAAQTTDAVILRAPAKAGATLIPALQRNGHPYAVEVVGDPYDVFSPGAMKHWLRPFFRWYFTRGLRWECAQACAASYVTARALQERYPCPGYSVGFSDVELPEAAWAPGPRSVDLAKHSYTLVTVGTLEQLYKAPDVLIDAVALAVRGGLDLRLVMVGDGKHKPELQARAAALGIGTRVDFLGNLAAERVRAALDAADLFVLPSRQEGLPRAMVEAMARALPCVGSTVGGIPELLPPSDTVVPGDAALLAKKIREVVTDPHRLAQMSAANLAAAGAYREDLLRERRLAFYQTIKDKTAAWLAGIRGHVPAPASALMTVKEGSA